MNRLFLYFLILAASISCKKEVPLVDLQEDIAEEIKPPMIKFGYDLDDYEVVHDTVKKNEFFGEILEKNNIVNPQMQQVITALKDKFDVRKLKSGTPYTVLSSKDSLPKAQVLIFKKSQVHFSIIDFKDSITTVRDEKLEVKKELKTAFGIINSSLYQALEDQGLNSYLALEMADIYAWSINFFKLYKDDKFKLIYEQLYVNDTIPVGIGEIKAAYFEHRGKPYYAFRYQPDSTAHPDYYDDKGKTLRSQFLKAPLKFGRISSRYNLKRRIAFYGNKIRPHRGTDFAARIGTPILSTAHGEVIESRYKGGNGNYVKIKHNSTYSTQYLHMKKRAVKKGERVKQGQVIGYIGMTGNTSGPHVCYRFWKNGKQVNPLNQKLPSAKSIEEKQKPDYLEHIKNDKLKLDNLLYSSKEGIEINDTINQSLK